MGDLDEGIVGNTNLAELLSEVIGSEDFQVWGDDKLVVVLAQANAEFTRVLD